jgi:hypothetical protein
MSLARSTETPQKIRDDDPGYFVPGVTLAVVRPDEAIASASFQRLVAAAIKPYEVINSEVRTGY